MKRASMVFGAILLSVSLSACGGSGAGSMSIKPASLTEKEKDMVDLLKNNTEYQIYDFMVDHTVKSIQINTYELADGEWKLLFEGSSRQLTDEKGRAAIGFKQIMDGVYTAVQGEEGSISAYNANEDNTEDSQMSCATTALDEVKEITCDKEIPLAVQIVTSKNEVHSYNVDTFFEPSQYEKDGYEHVYAVTVCFSQKTMEESPEE